MIPDFNFQIPDNYLQNLLDALKELFRAALPLILERVVWPEKRISGKKKQ